MSVAATVEDVQAILAAPFAAHEVRFKPGVVNGNRAMPIWFIDARTVMDRLDSAFGIGNWQTAYRIETNGAICTLMVRFPGEAYWRSYEDFGAFSEQPDEGDQTKAAFSDGLKRVAVQLGCGRCLYRVPPQWYDYDPQKRRFLKEPVFPQPRVTV